MQIIGDKQEQGYFIFAMGKQYIKEAFLLSKTLRKVGDQRNISLLINECDRHYCTSLNIFDKLISFTPEVDDGIWSQCTTGFEKFCLYPRLNMYKYIPYQETIIIDSDIVCQVSPEKIWKFCSQNQQDIVMVGNENNPQWHWGTILEVSKIVGKHVPETHGGFFYIRKTDFLPSFFSKCQEIFHKYDYYKCKPWYCGGKTDEIIFAIAFAYFNFKPINFDDYPIMTFALPSNISLPTKLLTEGNRIRELNDYIPFIHLNGKIYDQTFLSLADKCLHKNSLHSFFENKSIFILWMQGFENAPPLVQNVVNSWTSLNPTWRVELVTRKNLFHYGFSSEEINTIDRISTIQAQSDYIRLHLLYMHGGVWADSTMLCMTPLDYYATEALDTKAKCWMYHGAGEGFPCCSGPASWFIVSLKGSIIIKLWKEKCDEYWSESDRITRTTNQLVPHHYFWMDKLFAKLLEQNVEFKSAWKDVSNKRKICCEGPGQSHAINRNGRYYSIDLELQSLIRSIQPYAMKLSLRNANDDETNNTNFVIRMSQDTTRQYKKHIWGEKKIL